MPLITASTTVIYDGFMWIFYVLMALVFVFTSATVNTKGQEFTTIISAFVSPVWRSVLEGFLSVVNLHNFQSQLSLVHFDEMICGRLKSALRQ